MKASEKYVAVLGDALLENGDGWVPCDDALKEAAQAVIDAFVDDLAKEMCPFCRDAVFLHNFGLGAAHISERKPGGRVLTAACMAVEMRRAAKKILEGA